MKKEELERLRNEGTAAEMENKLKPITNRTIKEHGIDIRKQHSKIKNKNRFN